MRTILREEGSHVFFKVGVYLIFDYILDCTSIINCDFANIRGRTSKRDSTLVEEKSLFLIYLTNLLSKTVVKLCI